MTGNNTQALSRLDRLVRWCKEASYELDLAKNHLRDPHLQAILTVGIAGHAGAARKLEERIAACDRGFVPTPAPIPFAGNSGWDEMSQAVARDDPGAILQICETGEQAILAALDGVAEDAELDETTRVLVRRHADEVSSLRTHLQAAEANMVHNAG